MKLSIWIKDRIDWLRRLPIRAHKRFEGFVTTYPGFSCRVIDKSSFLFMYDEIFKKEIYRFASDTDSPYILDCGANIGLATVYWKKLYPGARVVAFEPDPDIFRVLTENIHRAGTEDGVECVEAGVAPQPGVAKFFSDGADGGSIYNSSAAKAQISVQMRTLHDYLRAPVDVLKIDIEGGECEVLESIQDQLGVVKRIFIEYHSFASQEQDLDRILAILTSQGFRYYIEHVGIVSPQPFVEIVSAHGMDSQLNIFGYRP